MDFRAIVEKTNHIPSSVFEAEQRLWWGLLDEKPEIKSIVDFGTGWGKSAVSLALICPQAKVLTFDKVDDYIKNNQVKDYADYLGKLMDYWRDTGAVNLTQHIGSSLDDWDFTLDLFFDSTMIDVLNYDSEWKDIDLIRQELRAWLPKIKVNGYLFVHDWKHNEYPQVGQVIGEILTDPQGCGAYKLISEADCGLYTVGAFKKL